MAIYRTGPTRAGIGEWLAALGLGALLVAGIGCDKEDDEDTGVDLPDGYGQDTSVEDTGSGSDTTADTSEEDTEPSGEHCGLLPKTLGSLTAGASGTERGNLSDGVSTSPDCSGSGSDPGMAVYELKVDEPLLFKGRAYGRANAPAQPALEIHSGACNSSRNVLSCRRGSQAEALLEPGTTYYAWVHGPTPSTKPHYRIEWSVEEPACEPSKYPECSSGSLVTCPEPDERVPYACSDSCAGSERCAGDRCSAAKTLSIGSGAVSVTGDRRAYQNDWTAPSVQSCMDDGQSVDTSGVEIFAKLEGVAKGDTVVFDSAVTADEGESTSEKGASNLAFFVLDGCSADQCVGVGRFDQSGANRFEWTAPSAGPFLLVGEVLGAAGEDKPFEFDVTIK